MAKRIYVGVDNVARKVKKAYETVNGVYVLWWTGCDVWKKYTASRAISSFYEQDNSNIGYEYTDNGAYYGNPVNMNLYSGYGFTVRDGFVGHAASSDGEYKVDSTAVYVVSMMTVDQDKTTDTNIYVVTTWRCVASATLKSYYYYSKGEYIESVEAEEGQLPTSETPISTEDNGNLIYVMENGTLYCYEKMVQEESNLDDAVAVLDEAILDSSTLA